MTAPKRIQLRRTKGWRKPEGAIVVARPTRWGNPFRVGERGPSGQPMSAAEAVERYRVWALNSRTALVGIGGLRGHDLACWCPLDSPCHADVLLELANAPKDGDQ